MQLNYACTFPTPIPIGFGKLLLCKADANSIALYGIFAPLIPEATPATIETVATLYQPQTVDPLVGTFSDIQHEGEVLGGCYVYSNIHTDPKNNFTEHVILWYGHSEEYGPLHPDLAWECLGDNSRVQFGSLMRLGFPTEEPPDLMTYLKIPKPDTN